MISRSRFVAGPGWLTNYHRLRPTRMYTHVYSLRCMSGISCGISLAWSCRIADFTSKVYWLAAWLPGCLAAWLKHNWLYYCVALTELPAGKAVPLTSSLPVSAWLACPLPGADRSPHFCYAYRWPPHDSRWCSMLPSLLDAPVLSSFASYLILRSIRYSCLLCDKRDLGSQAQAPSRQRAWPATHNEWSTPTSQGLPSPRPSNTTPAKASAHNTMSGDVSHLARDTQAADWTDTRRLRRDKRTKPTNTGSCCCSS